MTRGRIATLILAILFLALGAGVFFAHKDIEKEVGREFLRQNTEVSYILNHREEFGWGGMIIGGILMFGLIWSFERGQNFLGSTTLLTCGVYFLEYYPKDGPCYSMKDNMGWVSIGLGSIFFFFFLSPVSFMYVKRFLVRYLLFGPVLRVMYIIPKVPPLPAEIYDAEIVEMGLLSPHRKQKSLPPHNK